MTAAQAGRMVESGAARTEWRRSGRNPFSACQTRAARGLLGWRLSRLAAEASLEPEALGLFETGQAELGERELQRLGAALRRAGVTPIPAALGGEGVRFCRPIGGEARAALAPGRPELPDWLPLVRDTTAAAAPGGPE